MNWNEYEITLCFENYFVSGVGYGETKKQALRLWKASLDFDTSNPIETRITQTAIMEENA